METKRNKTLKSVAAIVLAIALALTGTFAWQSISQTALNEAQASVNPGGRLHDDFNGENKDVYVENFTEENGGTPIFARIRLDEYMEIGEGAGLKTGDDDYATKAAKSVIDGADINDVTTWKTHIPSDTTDTFHDYWDWKTGGSTVFMPTFNKNKDSLKADINGTYDGTSDADDLHYDDYVTYADGQTKTADAVYDADTNDVDEGDSAVEGTNINTVSEEHTAKETLNGTVMTMAEWKAAGSKPGAYWVWDEDGWAYWAQPIEPGTATGLLLDEINLKSALSDSWYYGINVVGQFVTADDLGQDDNTGFYDTTQGTAPTDDALELLKAIGVKTDDSAVVKATVTVTGAGDATTVKAGSTLQMNAAVAVEGVDSPDQTVVWSVSGNTSTDTKISEDGLLTVGSNETVGGELTITATSSVYGNEVGTAKITVEEVVIDLSGITAGSTTTVNIDGVDYYVLAKDTANNRALIITKDTQEERQFDASSQRWQTSAMRTYLNGTWLDKYPTLKAAAKETSITTRQSYTGSNFDTTTDKVFLLSEADVFGTSQGGGTAQAQDYTFGSKLKGPGGSWVAKNGGTAAWYWLRSPDDSATHVADVGYGGVRGGYGSYTNVSGGVRPALWVNLA